MSYVFVRRDRGGLNGAAAPWNSTSYRRNSGMVIMIIMMVMMKKRNMKVTKICVVLTCTRSCSELAHLILSVIPLGHYNCPMYEEAEMER